MYVRCLLIVRCFIAQVFHGVKFVITSNGSNYDDSLKTLDGGAIILTCYMHAGKLVIVGWKKKVFPLTK